MGGIGSGGHAASGKKPKDRATRNLHGARDRQRAGSGGQLPPVEEFNAPNDLNTDERNVWLDLAPGAFKARTLTKATAYAFKLLCRNVLLEQALRADVEKRGGADHRGVLQRVENGLTAFGLRAIGKPILSDEPPKVEDPFAEFDGTVQ
jgi:hypothetical protein